MEGEALQAAEARVIEVAVTLPARDDKNVADLEQDLEPRTGVLAVE